MCGIVPGRVSVIYTQIALWDSCMVDASDERPTEVEVVHRAGVFFGRRKHPILVVGRERSETLAPWPVISVRILRIVFLIKN